MHHISCWDGASAGWLSLPPEQSLLRLAEAFVDRPLKSEKRTRDKMPEVTNTARSNERPLPEDYDETLLRLTHRLDVYRDPEQLMRALPAELFDLFSGNSVVLAFFGESESTCWLAIDGKKRAIVPTPKDLGAQRSLSLWIEDRRQPLILSSLKEQTPFSELTELFQEWGNQSLCVFPLNTATHRRGAFCIGRTDLDAFSEKETRFLSLIAGYVALALDDRIVHAQLESERTKLRLILDLNNSVVANLKLRNVLQSISPGIRTVMRVDFVAVILPDKDGKHIRLYALDFPNSRGLVQQDLVSPFDGSMSGEVLRSGKPWVGDVRELARLGFNHQIALEEGLQTLCMLPLSRGNRVLGVLCLGRLQKNAFTQPDVDFLSQIAGQLAIAIDNALAYRQITELKDQLTQEKLYLEGELRSEMNFEEIIGNSAALRRVLRQVEAVAPTGSTVLIYGETGTGKELIARAVHNLSGRRSNAFVKLNCAAIPTGLLESELFGHERGSFTGAVAQRIGRFELASSGTIFLDEVGEIPLDLQPKLLRVLQEREFERLGSSRTLRTDARLIAATNRDLAAMVGEQAFRSDLFYRLNVFPIHVPALRERTEDIPFLVRHFAQHFARNMKKQIDTISSETMNALIRYPWPGNIREMQNVIERAVILSRGSVLQIPPKDLKSPIPDAGDTNGFATLEEMERKHILSVLEQTHWVFGGPNGAAAFLGIKRSTLQFRMQKLGIARPQRSTLARTPTQLT
jgi:formate hydrogenlyase transcriptional activator